MIFTQYHTTPTNEILLLDLCDQINTGQADGTPGLDLNVAEAWELGYTGKGVTIGIMDDGEYSKALNFLKVSVPLQIFRI